MKQGQGNQCQTPGVKFEESTERKWGKRGKTKYQEVPRSNNKKISNGKVMEK